jgi:hypothetical protein
LFNHPQFPGAFGSTAGQSTSCLDCGVPPAQITSGGPGRIVQVSLKLVW